MTRAKSKPKSKAKAKPKGSPKRKTAPRRRKPAPPPPTWDEKLIRRLTPWRVEILGGILAVFGLFTLLTLPGWTQSGLLGWWANILRQLFGWGSYLFALSLIGFGLHLILRRTERFFYLHPAQVIGLELIALAILPLTHQLSKTTMPDAFAGSGGGIIGWALSALLLDYFGLFLTTTFHLFLLFLGIILLFRITWHDVSRWLAGIAVWLQNWGEKMAPVLEFEEEYEDEPAWEEPSYVDEADPEPTPFVEPLPVPVRRKATLPAFDLLQEGMAFDPDYNDLTEKRDRILETLADFGLPASIDNRDIRFGPAVTQFGVKPGVIQRTGADGIVREQRVRVNKIAALQKDIAMALAVSRIRIEAPVPGRGVVGIEVPNGETNIVRLRAILESEAYRRQKNPLTIGLGRDVSGLPVVTELSKLPHLLIAGTTGSGKSVCLNAIITNLIFNHTPEQLRLILIDPKRVEMIRFNGLPHLIGHTETDHERVIGVLRWVTGEMDQRYKMFANVGARNLNGYNRRIKRLKGEGMLPYILVVIDELADLMAIYPADIESALARIAQMARATGIHLIVATQRPSTDVITGLIKANFPARIAFSVASSIDSRVIIDTVGAESLLGQGDMLFLGSDAGSPVRVQGVHVTDDEVDNVVDYWQEALPDFEPQPPPWESLLSRMTVIEQTDDMLEKAVAFAQQNDNISTSLLQRKLRIGYPRAARLMEALQEMGMVGEQTAAGKTRRSLIGNKDGDALDDFLAQQDD